MAGGYISTATSIWIVLYDCSVRCSTLNLFELSQVSIPAAAQFFFVCLFVCLLGYIYIGYFGTPSLIIITY